MGLLDDLAVKYGTDKSSLYHAYTTHYERWFAPIREQVRLVLELGVAHGASLRMWRDYFPNATVWGLDREACDWKEERIKTVQGDQTDARVLDYLPRQFDIIIDDGGHQMKQQRGSFALYFPLVRFGGVYVIEDLHTSYWQSYGGGDHESTTVQMLKSYVDVVNRCGTEEHPGRRGGSEVPVWVPALGEHVGDPNAKHVEGLEFVRSMCCVRKVR